MITVAGGVHKACRASMSRKPGGKTELIAIGLFTIGPKLLLIFAATTGLWNVYIPDQRCFP